MGRHGSGGRCRGNLFAGKMRKQRESAGGCPDQEPLFPIAYDEDRLPVSDGSRLKDIQAGRHTTFHKEALPIAEQPDSPKEDGEDDPQRPHDPDHGARRVERGRRREPD